MEAPSFAYRLGGWVSGPSRLALFGFLLARPGVPFLPHGNTAALVLTVLAGVIASIPFHRWRPEAAIAVAAIAGMVLLAVLRMDPPTTSIVLIGTLIHAVTRAADNYPFIYGFVSAAAVGGIALQVFDLELFHPRQLLLSHEPWTSDRAGHQLLLVTGLLLLTAMLNVTHHEMTRLATEAKEAAAARDAAVLDERARIARELHDVVSHHVTAMTLQAEAAAMTGDKNALASVASAGREALTELRRMLGVLRRPDNDSVDALDPQPALAQLDALAERTSSGPRVQLERRGEVRPLSAGLELGVYRLVQEALTNCAKHSDATTVDVVLTYGASELTVDVVDNGRPLVAARVSSNGLGLVGMQERIALLDGDLSTGPRRDGQGFRVHASLPIDA